MEIKDKKRFSAPLQTIKNINFTDIKKTCFMNISPQKKTGATKLRQKLYFNFFHIIPNGGLGGVEDGRCFFFIF